MSTTNPFVSAQVKLEGATAVRRAIRRMQGDLSALGDVHAQVADIVIRYATTIAPRKTGRLAADMRSTKTRNRASVRAGRASVPYAGPVHWGWPTRPKHDEARGLWGGPIKGNPFITEAAQATEPAWIQFYSRELQRLATQAERDANR